MSEYTADIVWARGTQDFLEGRYSRHHLMRFVGGAEVAGSSSPHSVPLRPEAFFSGERLPSQPLPTRPPGRISGSCVQRSRWISMPTSSFE